MRRKASAKIYGVRIYSRDFLRIFRPIAPTWRDCVFVNEFGVRLAADLTLQDPLPGLRLIYGSALIAADIERQLVLLRGSAFETWGARIQFCEGALLLVFRETPSFDVAARLYRDRKFRLTAQTWPTQMSALLHMWDGVYWQLFTTEKRNIPALYRLHADDLDTVMYHVDLDRNYPEPGDGKLRCISLPKR